ncbi:isoamyl acetate-hydrolyzing esterase [Mactra antiquata]
MEKSWPKVILFGDSLTQYGYSHDGCWAAFVADHLQRKCDVINRGFSGYNTRWCKIILPKLVTKADVTDTKMVTIFLGANDSVDSVLCPNQHVPLNEFKKNMIDMVQYLMDIGVNKEKIVIISPPTCDEQKWQSDCEEKGRVFGKFNGPTKDYAKVCIEVGEEIGTQTVDLYTAMSCQKDWEDMLNDGLHFSPYGSQFLFEQLKPVLDKLTSNMKLQLPYWADIDNENPHKLLNKY